MKTSDGLASLGMKVCRLSRSSHLSQHLSDMMTIGPDRGGPFGPYKQVIAKRLTKLP